MTDIIGNSSATDLMGGTGISSSGGSSSGDSGSGEMKEGGVSVSHENNDQGAVVASTHGQSSHHNNHQASGGLDIHNPDQSQLNVDKNHEDNNSASASAALLLIREKYLAGMSTDEINYHGMLFVIF